MTLRPWLSDSCHHSRKVTPSGLHPQHLGWDSKTLWWSKVFHSPSSRIFFCLGFFRFFYVFFWSQANITPISWAIASSSVTSRRRFLRDRIFSEVPGPVGWGILEPMLFDVNIPYLSLHVTLYALSHLCREGVVSCNEVTRRTIELGIWRNQLGRHCEIDRNCMNALSEWPVCCRYFHYWKQLFITIIQVMRGTLSNQQWLGS